MIGRCHESRVASLLSWQTKPNGGDPLCTACRASELAIGQEDRSGTKHQGGERGTAKQLLPFDASSPR
jgi:hypothetical protein